MDLINNDTTTTNAVGKLFLARNNYHRRCYFPVDIEMVRVESMTRYTSLKDILDSSPRFDRKDSWREIPIKDPLLQHAAWAYLQPMPKNDDGGRNCAVRFKDCCCGLVRLFVKVLDGVVSAAAGRQCDRRRRRIVVR